MILTLALACATPDPAITHVPLPPPPAPFPEPAPPAPAPPPPHAQVPFRPHADAGADDLDGDGTLDRWTAVYSGGSGMGGTTVTVHPGGRRTPVVFEGGGSFGDFLSATIAPTDASDALVDGVGDLLYGRDALRTAATADGSFRWLWDRDARAPLAPTAPFTWVRAYDPVWTDGEPSAPDSQYRVVGAADWPVVAANTTEPDAPPARAIVAYFAHNHGAMTEVPGCDRWRLFTTAHGVAVRDADKPRFSWVWVTTHVTKLRWPTIAAATCRDGLVFIDVKGQLEGDVTHVVVSPTLGRYGAIDADASPAALTAALGGASAASPNSPR